MHVEPLWSSHETSLHGSQQDSQPLVYCCNQNRMNATKGRTMLKGMLVHIVMHIGLTLGSGRASVDLGPTSLDTVLETMWQHSAQTDIRRKYRG